MILYCTQQHQPLGRTSQTRRLMNAAFSRYRSPQPPLWQVPATAAAAGQWCNRAPEMVQSTDDVVPSHHSTQRGVHHHSPVVHMLLGQVPGSISRSDMITGENTCGFWNRSKPQRASRFNAWSLYLRVSCTIFVEWASLCPILTGRVAVKVFGAW